MRNKRVRQLKNEALEIMSDSIKRIGQGYGAYGIGTYSLASNPYKNFIRRYRRLHS